MWIREIVLKNFGKFRDKKILLSEGINVIYGENESGKSTIYTGIKGIFFGMARGRGKAALNDTFSQYEPWEEPNYYAGKIRFCCEGKTFTLERNFDKYGKGVKLFCEDDGEELSVVDGDLEMLLDGMDESEFENTVSIGQMRAETDRALVADIKNYAANYFSTGDSEINLAAALDILKERRKNVEKEIREAKRKKQEKRDKLELEASYVWKDLRSLEKDKDKLKAEWAESQKKLEELAEKERKEQEQQEERGHKWRVHPMAIFLMLGVSIAALFLVPKPWNYLVAVVIALATGQYVWNRIKDGRKKEIAAREAAREELMEAIEKQEWQIGRVEEEYQDKKIHHLNLKEQIDELSEVEDEFKMYDQRLRALEYAEEVMTQSSKEMQVHLEERINNRVSEILCTLTNGKYEKVWVDDELHVCIFSEGRKLNMEQVSRGTIEQIYFALRMAAIEIMHEEEYPVILDDAFAYYDDARLEAVVKWLKANRKQVIIFTCQKREEEVLRRNGIVFNRVVI